MGKRINVLDQGYVELVDFMGSDRAIVNSARVSVEGEQVKATSTNRNLIRYLLRKRHCYHPDMEVLTARGWVAWRDCKSTETFMVPNPKDQSLTPETLPLEIFDAEEEMECFENSRMSYCVTPDHKMWFKPQRHDTFAKYPAAEMPRWGHFSPGTEYQITEKGIGDSYVAGKLVGFYLGDGSSNNNGAEFHLRKDRKKVYLRDILNKLKLEYTERVSSTYEDAVVIRVKSYGAQSYIFKHVDEHATAATKALKGDVSEYLRGEFASGIFDGLVNSDGHINELRNDRIEFSSVSFELCKLFESLASMRGYDAHFTSKQGSTYKVYAYPAGRTSLEARKQYFSKKYYRGKVFCTTTSTGLLLVRGGPDKFSFVCGNTTPFESVVFTFAVKAPILTVRQWHR